VTKTKHCSGESNVTDSQLIRRASGIGDDELKPLRPHPSRGLDLSSGASHPTAETGGTRDLGRSQRATPLATGVGSGEACKQSMTILLTGCAGFIGARLGEMLLAEGHLVVGVDNLNDYYDARLKRHRLDRLTTARGFKFHEPDGCSAGPTYESPCRILFGCSRSFDRLPRDENAVTR
jgi:hypothetical protein